MLWVTNTIGVYNLISNKMAVHRFEVKKQVGIIIVKTHRAILAEARRIGNISQQRLSEVVDR